MTEYKDKIKSLLPSGYAQLNSTEKTMSDIDIKVNVATLMKIVRQLKLETGNEVGLDALMFVASNLWLGQVNMEVARLRK